MQQTATIVDENQLPREAASSPADSAGAREALRVSVSEPRPTTIIRAPTFSVHALAHAMRELIAYRDLLYNLQFPDWKQLLYVIAWSVGVLVVGMAVFRKFEPRLAEEL